MSAKFQENLDLAKFSTKMATGSWDVLVCIKNREICVHIKLKMYLSRPLAPGLTRAILKCSVIKEQKWSLIKELKGSLIKELKGSLIKELNVV